MILGKKNVTQTGLTGAGDIAKGVAGIGISIAMAALSAKAGDMVKAETGNYIDKSIGEVTKIFKK